jgi:V/A-type H+/Na+-transporting ATPase subunit E
MSNINNLTSKILEEARARSEEILKAAQEEEAKIMDKKVTEARGIEKEHIQKAAEEAITRRERILSGAELRVRNDKLAAKQQIVERVIEEALAKLGTLTDEEFLAFIKTSILSADVSGDEKLLVSKNHRNRVNEDFLKELNIALNMKGKRGNISLSSEERSFRGGFVLVKNGIEINNTFEALIQSMKDDLEYEVAKVLFS